MIKRTSVNITCILATVLNSMNEAIGSRGVYLSTAEGDDVADDGYTDGDTVAGGDARSSMSGGGRDRSS
jgi:hypothetical protein